MLSVSKPTVLYDSKIRSYLLTENIQLKGKAMPLQAWRGPEGSRRLRLSDFKTIGT